jgi:hypothetical protein
MRNPIIFVGGPLDRQRMTLRSTPDPVWISAIKGDNLSIKQETYYLKDWVTIKEVYYFYVHESLTIEQAIKKIFDSYAN